MAKSTEADASGPVDDNQARGAAQPVAAHRDGRGCARGVCVHTDWERDLIFVKEGFQRHRSHGVVVFEHGVQAQQE